MQTAALSCPSCNSALHHIESLGVQLDACKDGCGGLWFDPGELAKFEDLDSSPDYQILRVRKNAAVVVDRSKTRMCPVCTGQPLQARILEDTLSLEVDSCMGCGGVFLDLGELATIRSDRQVVQEMNSVIENCSAQSRDLPRGLIGVLKLLFT